MSGFTDTLAVAYDLEQSGDVTKARVLCELLAQIDARYEPETRTFVIRVTGSHEYRLPFECDVGVRVRAVADESIVRAVLWLGKPIASTMPSSAEWWAMHDGLSSLTFTHEGQSATIERREDGDRVIAMTRKGATTVVLGASTLAGQMVAIGQDGLARPATAGTLTLLDTIQGAISAVAREPRPRIALLSREVYDRYRERLHLDGRFAQPAQPPRSRTPAKRRKQRRGW